ncbi:Retrotransposon gag protein [Salix suchowensis]|nr:Retrotransposon gag protein [Salix suchowensis]
MELSIAAAESSSLPMQEPKRNKPEDISRMLDDLLEANIIELPEVKRPEKANQVDNLNYCKYHRLISHPVEKCFVLKDKIMRLHKNGDIVFDDEVATSNITTTWLKKNGIRFSSSAKSRRRVRTIRVVLKTGSSCNRRSAMKNLRKISSIKQPSTNNILAKSF